MVTLVLAACGGADRNTQVVAIPDQPVADAGAPAAKPEAAPPARVVDARTLPSGANGPRDARGMVGSLGELADRLSPVLLVNTNEMRGHRLGPLLGNVVVASLVGWNQFLPTDLIDPVKETDWVVMAGDIHLGSTARNVILARYNVNEARADVVWKELERRLPAKRLDTGVAGTQALAATVDGALRGYVRGKPGTLAIVPASSAKTVAPIVFQTEAPRSVRKDELLRFAAADRNAIRMFRVPRDVRTFRIWVEGEGARLFLHAEGDCEDEAGAKRAVEELHTFLEDQAAKNPMAAMIARGLLGGADITANGKTARYRGEIEERVLAFAAVAAGASP